MDENPYKSPASGGARPIALRRIARSAPVVFAVLIVIGYATFFYLAWPTVPAHERVPFLVVYGAFAVFNWGLCSLTWWAGMHWARRADRNAQASQLPDEARRDR